MKLNRAAIWIVLALSAALPSSALRLQRTRWPRPGSRLGTFSFRARLPGMLIIGANLWVGEEASAITSRWIRIMSIRSIPAIADRYSSKTNGVVLAAA